MPFSSKNVAAEQLMNKRSRNYDRAKHKGLLQY